MRSVRWTLVVTVVTIVVIVMAMGDRYSASKSGDKHSAVKRDASHLGGMPEIGRPSFEGIDKCHQPPFTGMCRAYFPMYYYNATLGECKEFIYGGCSGNDNRFKTVEECMAACHHPQGDPR